MSCNTFYKNFEKQSFLEQKAVAKNILYKYFIREVDSTNVQTVDNNSGISNISLEKDIKIGSSVIGTELRFRHKTNPMLRFKTFTPYLFDEKKPTAFNLCESLELLACEEEESIRLMLFLEPIKGGFRVYSHGIIGFLPKSHAISIFKKVFPNFAKDKKDFLSKVLFLSDEDKENKMNLPFWAPLTLGTVTILPNYRKNNFINAVGKKKQFIRNNLNFVFLTKKDKVEIEESCATNQNADEIKIIKISMPVIDLPKIEMSNVKKPQIKKVDSPAVKAKIIKVNLPKVKKLELKNLEIDTTIVDKQEVVILDKTRKPRVKKPIVESPIVDKEEVVILPKIRKPRVKKLKLETVNSTIIPAIEVEKKEIDPPKVKKSRIKKPIIDSSTIIKYLKKVRKPRTKKPIVEAPIVEKQEVIALPIIKKSRIKKLKDLSITELTKIDLPVVKKSTVRKYRLKVTSVDARKTDEPMVENLVIKKPTLDK